MAFMRSCMRSPRLVAILLCATAAFGCRVSPPEEESPPPDQPAEAVVDHLLCYATTPTGNGLSGAEALVRDQFRSDFVRFGSLTTFAFCNPTSKVLTADDQGGGSGGEQEQTAIAHPDHHLTAYLGGEDLQVDPPPVTVTNQFAPTGTRLVLEQKTHLLVPTEKRSPHPHPMPHDLDHFKCYEVGEGAAAGIQVDLKDELEVPYDGLVVGRPRLLCNPAAKRRSPSGPPIEPADIQHPNAHLVCYDVERSVEAGFLGNTQFGEVSVVATRLLWLCVPSTKRIGPL